jgi:hypothetical protein
MSTIRSITTLLILSTLALGLTACGDEGGTSPPAAEESAGAAQFAADLFVDAAPADAVHVFDLKQSAKEGDVVTVRGRIGGSGQPFVESRAALTIADTQGNITNCADKPDDSCPTPWDYCCDPPNVIMANTATVQVVDADGRPLKLGLEGAGGLEKSGFIVVTGTVGPRPDANVLVINATAIHVEE